MEKERRISRKLERYRHCNRHKWDPTGVRQTVEASSSNLPSDLYTCAVVCVCPFYTNTAHTHTWTYKLTHIHSSTHTHTLIYALIHPHINNRGRRICEACWFPAYLRKHKPHILRYTLPQKNRMTIIGRGHCMWCICLHEHIQLYYLHGHKIYMCPVIDMFRVKLNNCLCVGLWGQLGHESTGPAGWP